MTVRNSSRRRFLRGAGASITGISLAGCANIGVGGTQYNRRIAALTPLTGPLSIAGTKVQQIADMAVSDANEKYSDNEPVEITVQDSEQNVQTTRNLGQQAVDDGAVAITGTISSDVGISMRDFAMSNEIPFVPTVAVNSDVTQEGTEYVTRTYGDVTQLAIGACAYMESLGLSNISVLGADYAYPRDFIESIKEHGGDYGVEVIQEQYVPLGTQNFNPAISNINLDETDALFHIYPGANATVLTEQLKQNNVYESIKTSYGGNTYSTPSYANAAGETKLSVSFAGVDRSTEKAQQLESQISDQFDVTPDVYHFLGYDSLRYTAEAIHQAEEVTPAAVYDSLQTIDFQTWTDNNTIEIGPGGYNAAFQAPSLRWVQKNGEIVSEVQFKSEATGYK